MSVDNIINLEERRHKIHEELNSHDLLLNDDGLVVGIGIMGCVLEYAPEDGEVRYSDSSGGMTFTLSQFVEFMRETYLYDEVKGYIEQEKIKKDKNG